MKTTQSIIKHEWHENVRVCVNVSAAFVSESIQ